MAPDQLSVLIVASVLVPAVTGIALMVVLSGAGGWSTLAKRFAFKGTAPPTQSTAARVGLVKYDLGVSVAFAEAGIHLRFFWGALHPPLLIPWSAVRGCRRETVLFRKFTVLDIDAGRQVRVMVQAEIPGEYASNVTRAHQASNSRSE